MSCWRAHTLMLCDLLFASLDHWGADTVVSVWSYLSCECLLHIALSRHQVHSHKHVKDNLCQNTVQPDFYVTLGTAEHWIIQFFSGGNSPDTSRLFQLPLTIAAAQFIHPAVLQSQLFTFSNRDLGLLQQPHVWHPLSEQGSR